MKLKGQHNKTQKDQGSTKLKSSYGISMQAHISS